MIIKWTHKNKLDDGDYDRYYYQNDHPILLVIWRLIWIPCSVIIILGIIFFSYAYWRYKPVLDNTPKFSVQKLKQPLSSRQIIKASDGTILWQNSMLPQIQITAKQASQPLWTKKALLSIEDRNFYHESGVNYVGMLRAAFQDVMHRNQLQGGSTLTQQLVKLSYFSTDQNQRTINRKLQEVKLAHQADNQLSKNQILAAYMNKVYLGQGIFGMASAAKYYMNRPLNKLSISQSAVLAGLVQSPSGYDPYLHPDLATKRRNIVLKSMYDNHMLNSHQYRHAISVPLKNTLIPMKAHKRTLQNIISHTYLAADFIQRAKTQMIQSHGNTQTVITSLNWPIQKWLALAIKHNDKMALPNKQLQVGITVMNNQTGQVIAQIGNRQFNHLDGFNRAVQTNRSSGSVIKPVLDYGPALDQLHWGSNHTLYDEPFDYPHSNIQVHDWDGQYMGRMTVKKALYLSRNVPAIKTFLAVGAHKLRQYTKQFGINQHLTPANAIGLNASSEQMASAFSSLARQGIMVKPRYINHTIINHHRINATSQHGSLFSKQAAFMLTKSLENVPTDGQSGYAAQINHFTQAGKTGTIAYATNLHMPANAISDAWYVGYNPQYTISVWTGYDNPNQKTHVLSNNDDKIPELIYKRIMLKLKSTGLVTDKSFAHPSGVQQMMDNSYDWTRKYGSFISSPLVK